MARRGWCEERGIDHVVEHPARAGLALVPRTGCARPGGRASRTGNAARRSGTCDRGGDVGRGATGRAAGRAGEDHLRGAGPQPLRERPAQRAQLAARRCRARSGRADPRRDSRRRQRCRKHGRHVRRPIERRVGSDGRPAWLALGDLREPRQCSPVARASPVARSSGSAPTAARAARRPVRSS